MCYDNRGYCASTNNVKCIMDRSNFHLVIGDVCDKSKLQSVMDEYSIDTIIHMAAESHVDNSFGNPYKFTETNVYGTQVLLEAAKTRGPALYRFIHMSTDEVYGEAVGTAESADLTETAILAPTNPYAASKAGGDMLVCAYLKSFGIPAIIVRCNNVYGPLQFPEKIIPKFIRLLQAGKPCSVHGTGRNTRRYLYGSDAVDGLDTVLHRGQVGGIYNVGSEMELANLEVCEKLVDLFGKGKWEKWIQFTKDRPFNDARYAIDSTKLKMLGWAPKVGFEEGLKRTVDWYNQNDDSWWKSQPEL